jgi:diketogulonate reductase-like aldo/keto reductase
MEHKTVAGLKLPVLGLGTWKMGGKQRSDSSRDSEEISAIKEAIKLGMTHIDTAEIYGDGHSEELVGQAIKEFDRKKLFITTKVSGGHLHYEDVLAACERSLRRLQTSYVDLYLIHWPNDAVPIKETMSAMNELVDKKLVRFIGLSNFNLSQMKEAQKHSKHKIIANQVEYNLVCRDDGQYCSKVESEVVPYCQEHDIFIVAYRPLANGTLAKPGSSILDELAKKYKKTQAQIAINWLISKKNVITIPKASNIAHLREDAGAIGWKLSGEDVERLDRAMP